MRLQMIKRTARRTLQLVLLSLLIACGGSDDRTQNVLQRQTTHDAGEQSRTIAAPPLNVDGRYLKAWSIAADRHQAIADLTVEQKQIDNYVFQFSEDAECIQILFMPKLSTTAFRTGGETADGRSARYRVDKKTYRILAQTFFE
jgi:hypothetical protein